MTLSILYEASRTAGTAMILLGVCCLLMGMCGIVFTLNVAGDPRGPAALRLARILGIMGGAIGLIGAMLAVPYFWMIGQVAEDTLLLTEMCLLGVTAVWAVVGALLLDRADETA